MLQINKHKLDYDDGTKNNDEYKNYIEILDCKIKERDYEGLLKFCNLKKTISKGLCNRLSSNFEKQAVGVIRMKLNTYVRENILKIYKNHF